MKKKVGFRYYNKDYNLPRSVSFCKRCVNSNQRPHLKFDEDGVCSACHYYDYKNSNVNWELREKELQKLLKKHRKNDGSYDVIVPSSGGKDSSYVAHILKNKYKMNPLTVTWSPNIYTEIGFQNHQSLITKGNLANILVTPPGKIHKKLTQLSLEVLGDPFLPFIFGQMNCPLQMSIKFKIPLIFYGENPAAEYEGNIKASLNPKRELLSKENEKFFMSGIPPEKFIDYGVKKKDLVPYKKPTNKEIIKHKTELHYFSYYHNWVNQNNYYYAVKNTGFKPNPDRTEGTYSKYASLDDKIDGFHYYFMFIKFGFARATSDAAIETRDGFITRNEAIELVGKFDGEFPKKYFKIFLDYCEITETQFIEYVDSWRPKHLWIKDKNIWKLRHKVNGEGFDDWKKNTNE